MRKQDQSRVSESCETSSMSPGNMVSAATAKLEDDSSRPVQNSSSDDRQCEAITSSWCGESKGRVPEPARPLRLQCQDCEELLHELSNVITPLLMHAQMLEWKLPSYSHLKRLVRDLERHARRASELVKALVRRVGDGESNAIAGGIAIDSSNRTAPGEAGSRPHKQM